MARRSRRPIAVAALGLLAAGCGTTVSGSEAARTAGLGAMGNSLSVPAQTGTATDGTAAPGGSVPGVTGPSGQTSNGSTTVGAGASGQQPAGQTSGVGGVAGSGPGVTPTKIYIGIVYSTNADAVNKATGANGISTGDTAADAKAVIDDINKHGGVAGRELSPIWYAFDSTSTQPVDAQWSAACAKFTQDNKIFAAFDMGTANYRRCLHSAGVVQISANLPDASDAEFAAYPNYIELGYPRIGRLAATMVSALADQGYFSGWDPTLGQPRSAKAKIGIVTYNDQAFGPAVDQILVPGLKRLGFTPEIAKVGQVSTASDYSSQAAAIQSAQLKFAADGVDHVIMFEGNGGLSLFFMNQAESQHYHPRYGVNSSSGTEVLINSGDVQKDQAVGAIGYGWIPSLDLTADRNPDNGPYSNAARRHCLAVMKGHGISYADSNAESVGLGYCSQLYLLKQALDTTPRLVTMTTFLNAVDHMGWNVPDGGSLGEFLAPGRHDGTSKYYYWKYFGDCQCLHYYGPRRTLP
ncbi:MAG TPA: ABC transporter substrate-binding protein [Gaiellales bacterium]|nr:ABC transporter substrate-binding protein [Gaiellales bacterium]